MVGVPGRSKGCGTCKRRRKRCDLKHPTCGACQRLGLECEGYAKRTTFINYSDTTFDASPRPVVVASTVTTISVLPPGLDISAFRAYSYSSFLEFFFPPHMIRRQDVREHWVLAVPKMATENELLARAFDAVCTSRLGLVKGDARLQRYGSSAYGDCLKKLQDVLTSLDKQLTTELLATIMALSLYEIFGASSDNQAFAWVSHIQAVSSIVRKYQRKSDLNETERFLLMGCRIDMMIWAIGKRNSALVTEPDWDTSPWKTFPKDAIHTVIDSMVRIPAIMEQADEVRLCITFETAAAGARQLAARCTEVESELRFWYETLSRQTDSPVYWTETSTFQGYVRDTPLCDDIMPEDSIRFPDENTAYAMLLYWAALSLLYSTHALTWNWIRTTFTGPDEILLFGDGTFTYPPSPVFGKRSREVATNIANSMEYFIRPDASGRYSGLISFPMSVAFGYFKYQNGSDVRWYHTVLMHQRLVNSIPLDTFLDNMWRGANLTMIRQ